MAATGPSKELARKLAILSGDMVEDQLVVSVDELTDFILANGRPASWNSALFVVSSKDLKTWIDENRKWQGRED
jgi:hypothetical protein